MYCGSDTVDEHAMLMEACGVGDTAEVKRLLLHHNKKQQGLGGGTCTAHEGPTLLMAAARAGAVDIVRILLGVDQLETSDEPLLINFDVNKVDVEISVR